MNFLRRYSLLTEVLYYCSNQLVHFLILTHPSSVCNEFLLKSIEINSFEILFFLQRMLNKIRLSTDWGFISVYSF